MSLRPTRRLPGMMFAALVIYIFATNSQVIWLYLVASLVAGLALTGLAAPWLSMRGARPALAGYRRAGFVPALAQDRDRLFAGDLLTIYLEMGEANAPVAPRRLVQAGGMGLPIAGWRMEGSVLAVDLVAAERGALRITSVDLATTWPLGMAQARREVRIEFEVLVHPTYALPDEGRRPGRREPQGSSAARGGGEEFLGLREYRSGDSRRRIHWPTSARTGSLMVVETARESSNASLYELELEAASPAAVELAVRVTASLGAGNVAAGVPMTMTVGGQPRPTGRWGDALGALARAEVGGRVARPQRDALKVAASGGQVTVTRGEDVHVFDSDLPLESALAVLGGG